MQGQTQIQTVYMPDGRPAPWVMTKAEVMEFLRIDQNSARFRDDTLNRIRRKYGLDALQVGKHVHFRLPDVVDVLERMVEQNPR